jgi:spermidine/putrescine transport system permease protein
MLGLHGAVNSLLSTLGIPPQVMTDNFFGLMIGFLTLTLPLVCLLQILSLSLVDKRLVEAAWNLGAGPATTVRTIIIPSARAGLILGSAFAFVLSFGDFVSPDLLGGRNPPLISLLIIDQVKGGSNWPRAAVIAMMMILTLLLVVSAAGRLAYPKRK